MRMRITDKRRRARTAAVLLWMTAGACGQPAPRTAPAPPPPPAPVSVPARSYMYDIRVCVVDEQGVREVPARYHQLSHDTLVEGRTFAEAYPTTSRYAREAEWYINSEGPTHYGRYGLPRILQPHEIVPAGEYRGVLMFREVGDLGVPPQVLYAAVEPNCQFQIYGLDMLYGGVRG